MHDTPYERRERGTLLTFWVSGTQLPVSCFQHQYPICKLMYSNLESVDPSYLFLVFNRSSISLRLCNREYSNRNLWGQYTTAECYWSSCHSVWTSDRFYPSFSCKNFWIITQWDEKLAFMALWKLFRARNCLLLIQNRALTDWVEVHWKSLLEVS